MRRRGLPKKGGDGAASHAVAVSGRCCLAASNIFPHRLLLPPPFLLDLHACWASSIAVPPNPNHSAAWLASIRSTPMSNGWSPRCGGGPLHRGMVVEADAVGGSVSRGEVVIRSGEALWATAYVEAGAPPCGEHGWVLWLISVKGCFWSINC